jgi:transglycosylase-like protein with SLT domain/D-alanyl-D-alanine carboxypeptidase-like protein/putative Flp pilus-assembly TadE/G-like protein
VSTVGEAPGSAALAAALAAGAANARRAGILVDLSASRARRPTILASAPAREAETALARALPDAEVAARGMTCQVALAGREAGTDRLCAALAACEESLCIVHSPAARLDATLDDEWLRPHAVVLRADLDGDRPLAALAAARLIRRGLAVRIAKRPLGWLAARLALAGLPPAGDADAAVTPPLRRLLAAERGQALVLALGAVAVLIAGALALVSIAGALTGKARVQRAADLAALSAARSMRDELPRLLSPPLLPNGAPNPRHLGKHAYLRDARTAARRAAGANGVAVERLRIGFPDRGSFAPLRARVAVLAELRAGAAPIRVTASAVAEAAPPSSGGPMPAFAAGGGYSGRLEYRQGEGMRPDVAAAFDAMSSAAARAGLTLVVTSGYRSDAEQAKLFAANPDPRWVAPPGRSLHRCATELDLGPASAYGWLAANAPRFGFVARYSWEPWHFGYGGGPPPCSAAGNTVGGAGSDGAASGLAGLPSFVPPPFRGPLLRSAARWDVSAALLAAQLLVESNFNPLAVSSAGAQGIAQFMPSTAAAYGLRDPFDPEAAIDAQAHLMSDLIKRFGSAALALAAYNAGPGPVAACGCVPAIPETSAYVGRILALLEGAGVLVSPPFEVRLIE